MITAVVYQKRSLTGRKQWRWRAQSANNEIIATGEGYSRKEDARHAIDLLVSPNIGVMLKVENGDGTVTDHGRIR